MDIYLELLSNGIKEWGIELDESQLAKFKHYLKKIQEWNKKINITSIDEEKEIIIKHFLDSLAGINYITEKDKKIIDIGTGAGLPGLPLKIVLPGIEITFVDSSTKKTRILEDICQSININQYQVISSNIESLGQNDQYRSCFDIVLSRALAPLNILLEYGLPLLKKSGRMIIYKGPKVEKEVENSCQVLDILHGKIQEKAYFCLPFTDLQRSIIVVEKMWKTPEKYPRNVGIPRKKPL